MSRVRAPQAVLWDMDGTLINTEPLWAQATFELSEFLGKRLSAEERRKAEGVSFPTALSIITTWTGYSLQPGDTERLKRWMQERMQQLLGQGIELNPGIRHVLDILRDHGIPMAIATNTERALAQTCIDFIGNDYFQATVTGDEVSNPKPAPDMYLKAAQLVGAEPSRCIAVEDSQAGMQAAIRAGARVLGLADYVPKPATRITFSDLQSATLHDVARWYSAP
ncbi:MULTISPECIES: HAD family phosphatase [Corynebacterium]|uniref:HAD family hydrolase n=1 Tax=Corynebacterium TaxID=1716 RepID=UPI001FED83AD|nr:MULTISPECIES: HAD family phosphatase [Corynebacterium]MCZ2117118.1 HAD family phosphatase [Corynebacterium lipophilum]MDK8243923.1 HAD family phosphatase [Corynebacterium sp. UMB10321]UUA86317.1 HAD family phosphatase [Corynebacterium pseudogenitalium]WPJ92948.1 HAD family phosphatase [Corynebacterium sp. UMB2355A]